MKKLLIILMLALPVAAFGQLDTINVGSSANSGTGESLRSAMLKTNNQIKAWNAIQMYNISLAEMSILNGATISTAELNALDGVTGNLNYSTENYGATGTGDVVLNIGATMTDPVITNAPRSTGTVVAGTGITAAMLSRFMYFNTASAIDISADPQIANGTSGQVITIIGSSDTNTLTLDDSTGLRLSAQCVLGIGDTITLLYEGTIGDWIELGRSNN